jgi:sigma-E factor negative regulatory protein RseC
MATNSVTHPGTVINVFKETVTVSVESSEACGSCASRSACSLGVQSNTRNILVNTTDAASYSVGDRVIVSTRTQMGLMAVALCYLIPAVVLVGSLATAVQLCESEGLSAVISLLCVALYYGVLCLRRGKIAKKVSFTIEKL